MAQSILGSIPAVAQEGTRRPPRVQELRKGSRSRRNHSQGLPEPANQSPGGARGSGDHCWDPQLGRLEPRSQVWYHGPGLKGPVRAIGEEVGKVETPYNRG